MKSQLDHLDTIAARLFCAKGDDGWGVLSTGEKLYVALAANRADLLAAMNYTVAEALVRIGEDWCHELTCRWRYGVPEAAR